MAHRPHWQDAPREAVRAKVSEFLGANSEGWIIDGNYQNMVADITWNSATDIIWLITPFLWSFGGYCSGQLEGFVAARNCGVWKDVLRHGGVNFFLRIPSCSFPTSTRLMVVYGCFGFIGTGVQCFIGIWLERKKGK